MVRTMGGLWEGGPGKNYVFAIPTCSIWCIVQHSEDDVVHGSETQEIIQVKDEIWKWLVSANYTQQDSKGFGEKSKEARRGEKLPGSSAFEGVSK